MADTAVAGPRVSGPGRPASGERLRPRRPGARRETLAAYGFIAPNYLLLLVFVLVPLVGAFLVSLQRTDGFGAGAFAGLDNYARLVSDPLFWRALGNTVLFTLLVTPLSMLLGLIAATLLNAALPARPLWRSLLILPMAVSGVATALIGVLVFDQNSGILNRILTAVGLSPVTWQSDAVPAFATIVLATVWWRTGFNMLIYLAGLQGIGPDLYEAATLDGANRWQRFRNVTVPLLGPTSFFLVVLNVIFSFQVFDIVFVLTGGGPGGATSVLVTYAYETGFVTRDQGYAAAIGMVLFVFALVFAAAQYRASRTKDVVE
ncbi:carbohydrate ABC transporter permease [Microbacterium enclense]|uniref:Multiple sugar transport system permease protein n=1 Tax=Microbacterium enclense TaxID=993073 RepID=A0A1G6GI64_9MICO|nr:sugar ABC transporter permease [Microbacterium enclense]SDB81698.1 multiple sugar transport system permease protein [Microbacterium enclense]